MSAIDDNQPNGERMGEPAEATVKERAERRALARSILEAVRNDEPSPLEGMDKDDVLNEVCFQLAQEIVDLDGGSTIGDDDIDTALGILERASKGPALWVEPATGVDDLGVRCDPVIEFAKMLSNGQFKGEQVSFDQAVIDSKNVIVHGVSIPCDGQHVSSIVNRGEHLVVAITGNGPTSEANAKAIAMMLDPTYGWAATLRELRSLRSRLAAVGCTCSENPPTDWTTGASIPHHIDCNRFCIDLPDADKAPAAYREAMARTGRAR